MNKIKVRIIGTKDECERILSLLPKATKVRKFDRSKERVENPYNKIFGTAEYAYYAEYSKKVVAL